MSKSAFVTLHRINRRQSSSLLSFLITFFCPWKIEHQNNPQRTADKIQSPFKNRQNNNERRHSHLAATGWKWQNKGDTVTKVPKPTTPLTLNFQSVNCLLPRRISFSTTYTTAHGRKRGKNRVHKQGIKLPLYKNRSFSKCFFFSLFFSTWTFYRLCNKESSDCVTSSAFPDYTFWTYNCQATHKFWRV